MDRGNADHHFAPGRDGAGAVEGGDEGRRRLLRAVTFPVAADEVLLAGVGGLRRAGRSLPLPRYVWRGWRLSRVGWRALALSSRPPRTFLGRRQRVCGMACVYCSVLQPAGVSGSALAMAPRNPREHAGVAASPGRFLKRRRHVIQRTIRSENSGALWRGMVQPMCKDAAAHD